MDLKSDASYMKCLLKVKLHIELVPHVFFKYHMKNKIITQKNLIKNIITQTPNKIFGLRKNYFEELNMISHFLKHKIILKK